MYFEDKARQLKNVLDLNGVGRASLGGTIQGRRGMKDQRSEELEEKELLTKDISKYSEQFTKFDISFEKLTMGPVSVDLNSFVPAILQVGGKALKAIQPFSNTKVSDALSFNGLGAVMPHVQHLLHLGDPLEYDMPFEIRQASNFGCSRYRVGCHCV